MLLLVSISTFIYLSGFKRYQFKGSSTLQIFNACVQICSRNVFLLNSRYQRAKPIIIDPGLYSLNKSDVFWVSEKRSVPTAYRLFTGEIFHFSVQSIKTVITVQQEIAFACIYFLEKNICTMIFFMQKMLIQILKVNLSIINGRKRKGSHNAIICRTWLWLNAYQSPTHPGFMRCYDASNT